MKILPTTSVPIKAWVDYVPFELEAEEQLKKLASLSFIYRHIAVMPDAHVGKGSTVGTVIATEGHIIPAAVGVDIGCGMMAVRPDGARAAHLRENLAPTHAALSSAG